MTRISCAIVVLVAIVGVLAPTPPTAMAANYGKAKHRVNATPFAVWGDSIRGTAEIEQIFTTAPVKYTSHFKRERTPFLTTVDYGLWTTPWLDSGDTGSTTETGSAGCCKYVWIDQLKKCEFYGSSAGCIMTPDEHVASATTHTGPDPKDIDICC